MCIRDRSNQYSERCFLGLPASDQACDMRVVDIYRREGEKLAENWVFIDLPWWLKQQGLDILERTAAV